MRSILLSSRDQRWFIYELARVTERDAYTVESNVDLLAATRGNINVMPLGSYIQAVQILTYMIFYMLKDGNAPTTSLPLLRNAAETLLRYGSAADDAGTSERTVRFILQRACTAGQIVQKSAQTVARCLSGAPAEPSSTAFAFCFTMLLRTRQMRLWNETTVQTSGNGGGSDASDGSEDSSVTAGSDGDEGQAEVIAVGGPAMRGTAAGSPPKGDFAAATEAADREQFILGDRRETAEAEDDNGAEMAAVACGIAACSTQHYLHRGHEFRMLAPFHWTALVVLKDVRSTDRKAFANLNDPATVAALHAKSIFPFEGVTYKLPGSEQATFQHHPWREFKYQCWRETAVVPQMVPMAAPRMPETPWTARSEKARRQLEKRADRYAEWAMSLLVPWSTEDGRVMTGEKPSWDAFCRWEHAIVEFIDAEIAAVGGNYNYNDLGYFRRFFDKDAGQEDDAGSTSESSGSEKAASDMPPIAYAGRGKCQPGRGKQTGPRGGRGRSMSVAERVAAAARQRLPMDVRERDSRRQERRLAVRMEALGMQTAAAGAAGGGPPITNPSNISRAHVAGMTILMNANQGLRISDAAKETMAAHRSRNADKWEDLGGDPTSFPYKKWLKQFKQRCYRRAPVGEADGSESSDAEDGRPHPAGEKIRTEKDRGYLGHDGEYGSRDDGVHYVQDLMSACQMVQDDEYLATARPAMIPRR